MQLYKVNVNVPTVLPPPSSEDALAQKTRKLVFGMLVQLAFLRKSSTWEAA